MGNLEEKVILMPQTAVTKLQCWAMFVKSTAWQPDHTHFFIIHVSVALDSSVGIGSLWNREQIALGAFH